MLEIYPAEINLDRKKLGQTIDVCEATARVLSRHTGYDANISRTLLEACATVCKSCGDECRSHAEMHEHCRICAEACRACEPSCRDLLDAMS
jgi:hypothetical protein